MGLADWYIEQRTEKPSTPAAWTKYGPEIEADAIDLHALRGATFHSDGKSVTLSDGTKIKKILSRKTPWKKVG